MTNQKTRLLSRYVVAGLVAAAVLGCSAFQTPAVAQETEEEIFQAFAVQMGNFATGTTFDVQIRIHRWTSPMERSGLLTILRDEGEDEALEALEDQEETGSVLVGSQLPYALRYAWETNVNGRRRIIVATDRPISVVESFRGGRSLDYGFSLIQLDLDDEDKGAGVLLVGAQLSLDAETNVLEIESADSGVNLTNVYKR